MARPTIGDIVLYRDGEDYPAIVVALNDNDTINLTVFRPDGIEAVQSVTEDATRDANVPRFAWRWRPEDR